MTKKTRYLILLFGFFFFILLAPIIVLYVRGVTYDFANKKFVKTGILAIRSSPTHADVFLNGKKKRTKEGDIKFLTPGEYKLSLNKEGYFDWGKRLTIEEGKVSWATNENNKVYLLKNDTELKELANEAVDYILNNNNLIYLKDSEILVSNLNNETKNYPLPKKLTTFLTADKNYIVLTNQTTELTSDIVIFDQNNGDFFDIGLLNNEDLATLTLRNDNIYYLNSNKLYKKSLKDKNAVSILENITSYFIAENSLYFIQKNEDKKNLFTSDLAISQKQILLNNLPSFIKEQLFVTLNKQILILADGDLYLANSSIKKIVENVSNFNFTPTEENLPIFHAGQFDYYNIFSQQLNLITRGSENLSEISVIKSIGYAFYINGSGINAIELDTRDRQNHYLLHENPNVKKFSVYNSNEKIIFLENSKIFEIEIR